MKQIVKCLFVCCILFLLTACGNEENFSGSYSLSEVSEQNNDSCIAKLNTIDSINKVQTQKIVELNSEIDKLEDEYSSMHLSLLWIVVVVELLLIVYCIFSRNKKTNTKDNTGTDCHKRCPGLDGCEKELNKRKKEINDCLIEIKKLNGRVDDLSKTVSLSGKEASETDYVIAETNDDNNRQNICKSECSKSGIKTKDERNKKHHVAYAKSSDNRLEETDKRSQYEIYNENNGEAQFEYVGLIDFAKENPQIFRNICDYVGDLLNAHEIIERTPGRCTKDANSFWNVTTKAQIRLK